MKFTISFLTTAFLLTSSMSLFASNLELDARVKIVKTNESNARLVSRSKARLRVSQPSTESSQVVKRVKRRAKNQNYSEIYREKVAMKISLYNKKRLEGRNK